MPHQLYTSWGENLDTSKVLNEYPRPQMRRDSYINLNGYWQYAITGSNRLTDVYEGEILVPFSPEAALSGVRRQVRPEQFLHYSRTFAVVAMESGQRLLLHFGAVDQICTVFINGRRAGAHVGGYLPFTIDITDLVKSGGNLLQVVVKDYSDTSYHSRGKQKIDRGGMFYQAQSGIWQTVWMEYVPADYIDRIKITPRYDEDSVEVRVLVNKPGVKYARLVISDAGRDVITQEIPVNQNAVITVPNFKSWQPEEPFLYDMRISYGEDVVSTYFAMRKYSIGKDSRGVMRFFLNNRPYLHNGLLDQGYWPDGLYTAPSDEALIYDIETAKDLGYNMLRKHCKIEPARWYYHCDRLGMLVWQDMVNGGHKYNMKFICTVPNVLGGIGRGFRDSRYRSFARADARGRQQYYHELKAMMRHLYHFASIAVWVPFNEGWGQFDAAKATKFIKGRDSSRLVDEASGWFDQGGGDIYSIHNYFRRLRIKPNHVRVVALTEYGGYSYRVEGHSYSSRVYGYRKYFSSQRLTTGYEMLIRRQIIPALKKGLSGAVYTQLSDIEEEVNGIFTYDRRQVKIDQESLRRMNRLVYAEFRRYV